MGYTKYSIYFLCLILVVFLTRFRISSADDTESEDQPAAAAENDFAEFDDEEFVNEPPKEKSSPSAPAATDSPRRSDETTLDSKTVEKIEIDQENGFDDEFENIPTEEADEEDATVEVDNDQYDPLEFEGYEEDRPQTGAGRGAPRQQELKIAEVPIVLGRSWEHYFVEYLLIGCLLLYLVWYATGKTTNSKLVQAWLEAHQDLLESHFTLVGDEGTSKELPTETTEDGQKTDKFIKEADHVFTLWCSGRQYVEGLVVTLKLKKRQDLINSIWRMFRPCPDQMFVRVYMEKEDMDTFVLCLGKKSSTAKLQKEMTELGLFCPDRKSGDRFGLPSSMNVLAELGESVSAIVDQKVLSVMEKHESEIDYLFFSDQYTPKVDDTQKEKQLKRPDPSKILQFCFNLPKDLGSPNEAMERMQTLLLLSLYLVDKVHRYRLSREAKLKAEKNRQAVQEDFLKSTHSQRQEAAQLRREEKRREEKKRIQEEEDPDRQRKLEERDYRREMKKRGPKVKAVKVKSM